jgi:hypothetical protein
MKPNQTNSHANNDASPRRHGNRFVRKAIIIALGIASLGGVLAQHDSQHPAIRSANAAQPDAGLLVVSGTTGTVGMSADHADELIFAHGSFHSRECSKLGFRKSEASLKRDGDTIHFSAVNVSPKYGTLTWQGVIRDGTVQALYVWKKERMFWTIQRKYWFSGAVKNGEISNALD